VVHSKLEDWELPDLTVQQQLTIKVAHLDQEVEFLSQAISRLSVELQKQKTKISLLLKDTE